MVRAGISIVLAGMIAAGAPGAMAGDDPTMLCDSLAGSPEDLDLPEGAEGVAFGVLDPGDAAEQACLEAAISDPTARRFLTHLGRIYTKRGEYRRALEAYRLAHGRGSAVAANNLGAMYRAGQGVVPSETRATQYFRKAAHRGLPHAMETMAARARLGRGMAENQGLAFFWYEKAYAAGSVRATNDLAHMYQNGYGVREDDARAVALFAEALERDPAYALPAYNLAVAYENGEGVDVDPAQAMAYYRRAFEAGDADAAGDVGRLHAKGVLGEVDAMAAAEWYARGAAEGSLSATVSLADAYAEGNGVEADLEQARSLYAAALGLEPVEEWRVYIDARMDALPPLTE